MEKTPRLHNLGSLLLGALQQLGNAPGSAASLRWVVCSDALIAVAGVSWTVKSAQPAEQFPYWPAVLIVWLAAVLAYTLAWNPPSQILKRLNSLASSHRLEALLVVLLIMAALAIRLVALDDYPRVVGGDEGQAALLARRILEGQPGSPFSSRFFGLAYHPALWFYGQAAGMLVFGDSVAGSRAFSAFVGTLTVACTYGAARSWFGARVGFLSAFFLAAFPYHVHWSRSQLNGVGDTAGVIAVLWSLLHAFQRPSYGGFAVAGVVLGLSQYAYQSCRILLALVPLFVLREVVIGRMRSPREFLNLLPLAGGFLVAFLPMITYYSDHWGEYVGRAAQVSIFTSGWLAQEAPLRGVSELAVILDQLRRSFLVFFTESPRAFYAPGRPLLDALGGICLVVGVGVALTARCRRASFAILMSLISIISVQALTVDVPASARLVIICPMVAVLVGLGLDYLARLLSLGRRMPATVLASLGTLFLGVTGLHFYFFEYAPVHERGAFPQTELAYLMRTYPPDTRFLLFTQPAFSCTSHATIGFIAPQQTCIDISDANARPTGPPAQDGDVLVATSNRLEVAERTLSEQLPNYPRAPTELAPGAGLSIWRPLP